MINEKLYVTAKIEFSGNFRKFYKLFKDGKITFGVESLNDDKLYIKHSEMITDEYGDIYHFVDMDIEQGRRYSIMIEFECDIETSDLDNITDNIKFVCKAKRWCGASVVKSTITSVCVGLRCVSR